MIGPCCMTGFGTSTTSCARISLTPCCGSGRTAISSSTASDRAASPPMNADTPKQTRSVLAIDDGGLRGIISLGVLDRLEQVLGDRSGTDESFRLGDWFDLIVGSGSGAVLAAL